MCTSRAIEHAAVLIFFFCAILADQKVDLWCVAWLFGWFPVVLSPLNVSIELYKLVSFGRVYR